MGDQAGLDLVPLVLEGGQLGFALGRAHPSGGDLVRPLGQDPLGVGQGNVGGAEGLVVVVRRPDQAHRDRLPADRARVARQEIRRQRSGLMSTAGGLPLPAGGVGRRARRITAALGLRLGRP